MTKNVTHTRPNIRVRLDGLGLWLRGLDLLVRWVWALDWANFVDLHEFFNSIFYGPFWPKLTSLLFTKIYIFLNILCVYVCVCVCVCVCVYQMSHFLHHLFQIEPSSLACIKPLHNFEYFGPPSHISPNLMFLVPTYKQMMTTNTQNSM